MKVSPWFLSVLFVGLAPFLHAGEEAIHSITVNEIVPVEGSHGDTWDPAWAPDGTLYSASNDTNGFRHAGNGNVIFNEIIGDDPTKLDGKTVNTMGDYGKMSQKGPDGCTWKSSGCISIDGVLYLLVARHLYGGDGGLLRDYDKRQQAHGASFIKSTDGGKTWTPSAKDNYDHPMFPGSRFAAPYFIQYGQDGKEAVADNSDKYVYALSNNGFWDNGDYLVLGRVLRSKIGALSAKDWQFYTEGDGLADSAWSPDIRKAKSVLSNPDQLGMTRAVYMPAQKCYLMVGWYYPAGGGKLEHSETGGDPAHITTTWTFYVASHPWGPWRAVGSHTFTPQGFYCPGVCPKFTSPDGSKAWVFTAGDWTNGSAYKLTAVSLSIK